MIRTRGDGLFEFLVAFFLIATLLVILVPLWYVLVVSLTPLTTGSRFIPTEITFEAYHQLLSQPQFLRATLNSVLIVFIGVPLNLILTTLTAYPLSRTTLPGRRVITIFVLITFLFNAGLIPTFLLVRSLGLINTLPSVILPGAISVYNMLVMKTFFENLPDGLEEAARIDGANDFQVLWHVVLPLSRPILLTIGLFYLVGHWNEFFLPLIFLTDSELTTLPVLLHKILQGVSMSELVEANVVSVTSPQALRMAAVIITMIPMLLVYPWIQRHFIHGVLIGGIKE